MSPASTWMNEELATFRDTVARFVESEMLPHEERWRAHHQVDPEAWKRMGELGPLCLDVPDSYGGGGGDFRHEAIVYEESSNTCRICCSTVPA